MTPGATHKLHTLHVNTPLLMRVWIDGESYPTARMHGNLTFARPTGPCEQQLQCLVHPRDEPPSSPRSVTLRINLSIGADGTCQLSLVSPHWLINDSSLPLRMYSRGHYTSHVLEAPARADGSGAQGSSPPHLFTLSAETTDNTVGASSLVGSILKSRAGSARLGAALTEVSTEASFDSPLGGSSGDLLRSSPLARPPPRALRREDLSAPFAVDAVGNDGPLEVRTGDGTIAELAVHIGASQGALAYAGSSVVTVRDRFVLANDTGVDFDFGEPAAPESTQLLPLGGKGVPVHWRTSGGDSAHQAAYQLQRKLCVRPRNGLHDWSAPFSAEAVGKVVLKLRPMASSKAADDGQGDAEGPPAVTERVQGAGKRGARPEPEPEQPPPPSP